MYSIKVTIANLEKPHQEVTLTAKGENVELVIDDQSVTIPLHFLEKAVQQLKDISPTTNTAKQAWRSLEEAIKESKDQKAYKGTDNPRPYTREPYVSW